MGGLTQAELALFVKVKADLAALKSVRSAVDDVERSTSRLGGVMGKLQGLGKAAAVGLAGVAVAAGAFAFSAIGAASNLSESMSKVNVVFAENAQQVREWAADSANAFGQSKQQALEAAGTYGNLFQAFGVGRDEATKMSTSLVELAADLASFNNTSVDEALIALRSGLSGETEPLKRFGVAINDARLKDEALRLGLIKTTKEALDPGAKATAAYALIMKDTALAQGDFQRTSGGLANQQRILSANWANLKAQIGTALLPVMLLLVGVLAQHVVPALSEAATHFANFIELIKAALNGDLRRAAELFNSLPAPLQALALWLSENRAQIEKLARAAQQLARDALRGLVLIAQDLARMWKDHKEVMIAVGIAIAVLLVWMYAIPVAIAAVIVGIGLLRTHWDDIKRYFQEEFPFLYFLAKTYFDLMKNQIETTINVIRAVVKTALALLRGDWGEAWEGIKELGLAIFEGFIRDWEIKLGALRRIFEFAFTGLGGIVTGVWDMISTKVTGVIDTIKTALREFLIGVKAGLDALPGGNPLGDKLQAAINMLGGGPPAVDLAGAQGAAQRLGAGPGGQLEPVFGFARGTPFVASDGLAYLHRGEAVVPAAENRGGRGGLQVTVQVEIDRVEGDVGPGMVDRLARRIKAEIEESAWASGFGGMMVDTAPFAS